MEVDAEDILEAALERGVTLESIIAAAETRLTQRAALSDASTHPPNGSELVSDDMAPALGSSVYPDRTVRTASTLPNLAAAPEGSAKIHGLPRYEDMGSLGIGGMGEVRRVYDRQLGRTLALKIIHAPAMQQAGFVARFLEEAQATAQLQHPNIVPVYDLGELPDGRLWFTMQEVSGQTLGQVIVQLHEISEDRWKIPESGWGLRRVVDALRQVCEGVGYAHSRGVVHRDLKPANIMVGAHGEVLVLDWGLAKVLGNAEKQPEEEPLIPVLTDRSAALSHPTMVGAVAGTPAYMPPEQAQGRVGGIDARSDVYALGAVLYQILAGRPPYFGESVATVLDQVRSGPPVPLRKTAHLIRVSNLRREDASDDVQAGPPLPGALVDACERAMARSPDERYSSAGELAIALQAWLDGSQRRQDALLVVEQAASNAPKAAELRAQAKTLRAEAKAMLEGIESWRSEEAKAPGWAKEDQAIALEKQAELTELEEEQLLHASLTHARDLPEAHAALVARYRAEHQAAELARIDATRAEVLMREHLSGLPRNHPERANHVAYLRGNGLLSLATDPPGAEVLLHKYVLHNRRFVPQFERSLGVTPISKVSLPMGSYLVVLKHPERAEVRYPINIERQQHWDGVPPDSSSPDIVPLPLQNELTLNECYLPPGWFWSGGDTEVRNGLPRRRLWLGGLVIQRFPVTNRMYLDFLDDLVAQGRTEEALTHAPRERAGTAGEQGALICGFDGVNFTLRPDADGDIWDPDYPVTMIDWHAAGAYAAWFSARTGQSWRLPNELEWEKAARGVDGRLYPWGDGFDPSWACMKESHAGRLLPAVVDTYPIDESPYGVRGMAGNSVDWCLDRYLPHGASLTSLRVDSLVAEPDQPDDVYRVLRGGGWFNAASELDTSHRRYLDANYRGFDLGFRLVRPYSYP